jgi:hypothetical protein
MNMMLMSIGGEGPIGPMGVTSMELTVGSKMIPHCIFSSWRYKVTTTPS